MAIDLGTWWDQQTHAVYNPLQRQVGYYHSLEDLARGEWYVYTGEVNPGNSVIRIKNLLGVLENAGDYLISKGLVPVWISGGQKQVVQQATQRAASKLAPVVAPPSPTVGISSVHDVLGNLNPLNQTPVQQAAIGTSLGTVALWGAVGLLAFALVMKKA